MCISRWCNNKWAFWHHRKPLLATSMGAAKDKHRNCMCKHYSQHHYPGMMHVLIAHSSSQRLTPAYLHAGTPGSGTLHHGSLPPDPGGGESLWHVVKASLCKHHLSWTFQLQVSFLHGNPVTRRSTPINLCLQTWLWQWKVGELLCICGTGWAGEEFEVDWAWWMLIDDTVCPELRNELVSQVVHTSANRVWLLPFILYSSVYAYAPLNLHLNSWRNLCTPVLFCLLLS